MTDTTTEPVDASSVRRVADACAAITEQLRRVIVGQDTVIEEMLWCLLAGGHGLLVGVPGLAKTLLVRTLADTLGLNFNRVQFTPDLMPADIIGTEVLHEDRASGERSLRFVPGPIFAEVVLADEINRTPPKTQSALLEAMQERQVTVGGKRHPLPDPFFVLATQNPIEQEGTYPLPEAQRDRFLFEIRVGYPQEEEEFEIVRRTTGLPQAPVSRTATAAELHEFQQTVRQIPVADHVIRHAMTLARRTRREESVSPDYIRQYVTWGAGPRGSQGLVLGAKARAAAQGRECALIEDVNAVAVPVLRHRLITNYQAQADSWTADRLLGRLLTESPLG